MMLAAFCCSERARAWVMARTPSTSMPSMATGATDTVKSTTDTWPAVTVTVSVADSRPRNASSRVWVPAGTAVRR